MSENKHEHGYVGDILKITVKTVRPCFVLEHKSHDLNFSVNAENFIFIYYFYLEVIIIFSNLGLSPW